MPHPRVLDESSDEVDAALDRLAAASNAQWRAEVEQVRELLCLVDAWPVCEQVALDAAERLAGAERGVPAGAEGTTRIGEFLALEVGPVLGLSPAAAAGRISDAVNLRDRHPALWEAVQSGALRVWQARRVTRACWHLPAAAAQWVDARLAAAARAQPWPRALRRLDGLLVLSEPTLAAERARQARATRRVGIGRLQDGAVDLWGRLDAADGIALDHALDRIAEHLLARDDESLTREAARATALGVLARGQFPDGTPVFGGPAAPERRATLVVHVADPSLAGGDGVCRVEGWGPYLVEALPRLLQGCRVVVRPVVDPARTSAVDSYEIPEAMRLAVTTRNPVDVFPFGTRSATSCDLDHTMPFDHSAAPGVGQTRMGNLGPLSRRAHRAKTHGGWHVEQLEAWAPGTFVWTSPHGRRYWVTPSGTHRLPGVRPRLPRRRTPTSDQQFERPGLRVEWRPAAS